MMNWFELFSRRITLDQIQAASAAPGDNSPGTPLTASLRRTLTALDLILYGVGSSVGAGIYVLVGLGAQIAGPSIALSFALCGGACILTALCYAEFASQMAVTGSAFVYSYVAFGEGTAWLVGWNLTLGYGFTTSVVARAWADYLGNFLIHTLRAQTSLLTQHLWLETTLRYITEFPLFFGTHHSNRISNYTCSPLSIVLVAAGTWILLRGVKDSSRFNNAMTIINISVLLLVIFAGAGSIRGENLTPFVPPQGVTSVLAGAGLVFFAFIGFDMVASLSEEVVHPERNMPIGIVGSLLLSTLLYVSVALTVVGMAPIALLGETVPIINAFTANACCTHKEQNALVMMASSLSSKDDTETCWSSCTNDTAVHPWMNTVAHVVSIGAIWGLMASCFTSLMGQPRILLSLARQGLIPPVFARVHEKTMVPDYSTTVTGIVTGALACFAPMASLANLISLGTLMVFTLVNVGVLFLRLRSQYDDDPSTTRRRNQTIQRKSSDVPNSLQPQQDLLPPLSTQQDLHHIHQHQQHPPPPLRPEQALGGSDAVRQKRIQLQRQQEKKRLIRWIMIFTFASLGAPLLLSHPPDQAAIRIMSTFVALSCFALAGWAMYQIITIPPSWSSRSTPSTPSASLHSATSSSPATSDTRPQFVASHTAFSCPWVPVVPLAGIAFNNMMMGSLPLESWALVVIWMGMGLAIYFAYGMHHSILNNESEDEEGLRLVPVHDPDFHAGEEEDERLRDPGWRPSYGASLST